MNLIKTSLPQEVVNILNIIGLNLDKNDILEPCCGSGYIVQGILDYIYEQKYESKLWRLFATDIQKKNSILRNCDWKSGPAYDFLSDKYPYIDNINYIITKPPCSLFEPFVTKSFEIADKGVLVLGKLQTLENINNSVSDVYIHPPRIKDSIAQVYAWFYWNKNNKNNETKLHWISRVNS